MSQIISRRRVDFTEYWIQLKLLLWFLYICWNGGTVLGHFIVIFLTMVWNNRKWWQHLKKIKFVNCLFNWKVYFVHWPVGSLHYLWMEVTKTEHMAIVHWWKPPGEKLYVVKNKRNPTGFILSNLGFAPAYKKGPSPGSLSSRRTPSLSNLR